MGLKNYWEYFHILRVERTSSKIRLRMLLNLDAEVSLKISFSEFLNGTTRTLSISGERVKVNIPKGMLSGSKLRVQGKGNMQLDRRMRGDLYINLEVEEHPIWKIDGEILRADLPISMDEVALGAIVTTITPYGDEKVKIPQGTLPGETVRLKGKGLPLHNHRGDLILTIILKLPDKWSLNELKLFDQLRKLREDDPRKDWYKSTRF